MAKGNGKAQAEADLDLGHELPAADDEASEQAASSVAQPSGIDLELQKVKSERDALLDRLARLQAEFDNARKRAIKEQNDFRDYAATDTIKSLLPALDSFERALHSKSDGAEFRNGVELIYKQLQDALSKLGVRPVPAKGEQFDPRVHEAIEMVETQAVPDHQVLEELQRGYKLRDRLLRPAMVKVAKNSGQ